MLDPIKLPPPERKPWFSVTSTETPQAVFPAARKSHLSGSLFAAGLMSAVGLGVIALAAGWIPTDPSDFKAPRWVVGVAGGIFLSFGLFAAAGAVAAWQMKRRWQEARIQFPNDPAMADYPWDREGTTPPRWKNFRTDVLWVVILTVFLTMFNWLAFGSDASPVGSEKKSLIVQAIVLLFDGILLLMIWRMLTSFLRARKFPPGRVSWRGFPVAKDGPIELTWTAPSGAPAWTGGTFILRCVEEFTVETVRKGKRQEKLVHQELWSQSLPADPATGGALPEPVVLQFAPSTTNPSSALSAARPIFWELIVDLESPGLDRKERVLVPVY